MRTNATAVANHFIDLAVKENMELRQFGLMKRVYLTHGFSLALYKKPALDPRFDVVEAWKNGPVIPSIYHSFKHYGNNPIREKSIIVDMVDGKLEIRTPELEDEEVKEVADAVWETYKDTDDFSLVKLLHKPQTPWSLCYIKGENMRIPDLYTKAYYKKLVANVNTDYHLCG
jgi:uncharacterized phage-associated protein